jgi:predicted RNA-binding Zn ribbon-like protein
MVMDTCQTPKPVTTSPRRAPAPGPLRLVQEFVNTRDIEAGTDDIASPAGLARWLVGHGLVPEGTALGTADVAAATELREALRALLHAEHGDAADEGAFWTLDRAAQAAGLAPRFGNRGYRLEPAPAARGITGALGRIVAAVAAAMDAGTWSRLKACRNDGCEWAFYDASRNRSGAWCTMAVCGNRMKVRAYRRRRRPAGRPAAAPTGRRS